MLRKLFIVFMSVWLPLQAVAALAMPYGGGVVSPTAAGDAQGAGNDGDAHWRDGEGHHGVHAHAATGDDTATSPSHHDDQTPSAGCERCGLCQFVHGGVVLPLAANLFAAPLVNVYAFPVDESFAHRFLDQTHRPPLASAA